MVPYRPQPQLELFIIGILIGILIGFAYARLIL